MLELSQVMTDIGAMGVEAARRRAKTGTQLQTALQKARMSEAEWKTEQTRQWGVKTSWRVADAPEPPSVTYGLPSDAPAIYTALATDGSQIPLDRHAVAPCYLLNVGEITLHYGTGERPRLASQATLHYKDEEIYQSDGGEPIPLSEKIIANRRLLAESGALARLIAENHPRHAIALVDDPLIVWTPPGEPEADQRKVIDEFCEMLEAGRQAQIPVVGYVSRPGGRDVVGALRLTLCDPQCKHGAKAPCAGLAALSDAQVFHALLPKLGDRSPLFGSDAPSLKLYPEAHRIQFFYLNVGAEIARLEVPKWVADDTALLDRVQVLAVDQARKGQGYPVALSEAHERAVIRGAERDAFFRLVENAFVRQNIPALQTRKALSKRTRVL